MPSMHHRHMKMFAFIILFYNYWLICLFSNVGVVKLQPISQIWLMIQFFMTYELRTFSTFLNSWKKIEKGIIYDTLKLYESQISVPYIKYYWKTASLIHLCVVHGCIRATMGSWVIATETIRSTDPKILTIWPFIKKFVDPCFNRRSSEKKNCILSVYP